ncbi:MAG: entry exclusion lipoprotein TrbK [Nitrosomonas sp.]|nr:entry exclusion lipoprotein TrbK [Nitrosomonas sp.]
MKIEHNVALVIGFCAALSGCGEGIPEVNSVNCSGRGMEVALSAFKVETERQAFIDGCEALAKQD